jgi:hypothetical protein
MAPGNRERTRRDPKLVPGELSRNKTSRAEARMAPAWDATYIGSMLQVFALTIVLGGILAVVTFGVLTGWDSSAMSVHGWIALALGTIVSLALGGGLMALTFYSARKGYDDRIEVDTDPDQPS